MEKQWADQTIEKYFQKIYGFAVKKSYSPEEIDDLCGEMVKEVYLSFLSAKEIQNVEGYVWRICEHTYAKYVALSKKKQGISIDGMELPYYDEIDLGEAEEELKLLRREVAFLSQTRRRIVFRFYYEGKSIRSIATEMGLPEGTVKWHLNKAKNELKEGLLMERKIGKLGLSPIEALEIGHNGSPGTKGGPEAYLGDKINLNIVYSVYDTPRTKDEIAQELGMTPVFLEERINLLEENGFLVKTSGKKYTTYVKFNAKGVSLEQGEYLLKQKLQAAKEIAAIYVPKIREAIKDFKDVYIPGGNRELFEAAVIFHAVSETCLPIKRDLSKYRIRTLDGGDYIAHVMQQVEIEDPEYQIKLEVTNPDYFFCGTMNRESGKYPGVGSWSIDNRYCSRMGGWQNNRTDDYEYLYEYFTGAITDSVANREKFDRLRGRGFLTEDGKVNVMVAQRGKELLYSIVPDLDTELEEKYASIALEQALLLAKRYPAHMQDLIVYETGNGFFGPMVAIMVMDELYSNGTFKPLTEQEKVTSQLIMFSDVLPK